MCVLEADAYLRSHFNTRVTMAGLARQVSCSTAYLQRAFRQIKGRTVNEYQKELRMREARRLLEETDLKIEMVAADVGYRSKKDFYRMIRLRFGCTPTGLRTRARDRQHVR